MGTRDASTSATGEIAGISYRTIAAIVIGVLVIASITLNRDETRISFIVFEQETALWIALTLTAASGFLAGFLVGRSRSRR
jgi:hypothetical protein